MKRSARKLTPLVLNICLVCFVTGCGGGGESSNSTTSTTSTPTSSATVPGAPTALIATPSNASISLAFVAPVSNGGAAITYYAGACTASGVTKTGSAAFSPVIVSGLTNATSYACSVTATNAQGAGSASASVSATPIVALPRSFKAQVWADNWFSLYVGENFVGEDSVPITTERSFNAETLTFTSSYPFVLNYIIKDYKQNDTGLEYIGAANQQIGDGGFIMQITDTATNKIVAVSSSAFKCTVIHKAPLNPGCVTQSSPTVATCGATILEEPTGWKTANFDTSAWSNATIYTAAEVGVKDGYNTIAWDASAKLIWTSDLKADNTLLCKVTVSGQ